MLLLLQQRRASNDGDATTSRVLVVDVVSERRTRKEGEKATLQKRFAEEGACREKKPFRSISAGGERKRKHSPLLPYSGGRRAVCRRRSDRANDGGKRGGF